MAQIKLRLLCCLQPAQLPRATLRTGAEWKGLREEVLRGFRWGLQEQISSLDGAAPSIAPPLISSASAFLEKSRSRFSLVCDNIFVRKYYADGQQKQMQIFKTSTSCDVKLSFWSLCTQLRFPRSSRRTCILFCDHDVNNDDWCSSFVSRLLRPASSALTAMVTSLISVCTSVIILLGGIFQKSVNLDTKVQYLLLCLFCLSSVGSLWVKLFCLGQFSNRVFSVSHKKKMQIFCKLFKNY